VSLISDQTVTVDPVQRAAEYEPAIDGLRAVAVIAVLLFHADVGWAGGGYLGVSVFFTISGYVVTRSMLNRHERGSSHSVTGFYTRRLKRLIPASMMTLMLVVIMGWLGWIPAATSAEMHAATFHYANWYQIASGTDYASAFRVASSEQSPVVHYWSLAVEEQFYLVWPLIFALALLGARRRYWVTTASLFLGLSALSVLWGPNVRPEVVYFSSLFRFPEILAGCLVAVILRNRRVPKWFSFLGVPCIAMVVLLMITTGNSSASWPYRGLLPVFACLVALLLASLQTDGIARAALSRRTLVRIGLMSYGVYLFHWPIFLMVDELDLDRWPLLVLKFGLTFAAAAASLRLLEDPIRASSAGFRSTLGATGVAMAAVVVATGLFGHDSGLPSEEDYETASIIPTQTTPTQITPTQPVAPIEDQLESGSASSTDVAPQSSVPPVAEPIAREFTNVLLVGDSTAELLGAGLVGWVSENDPALRVSVAASGGCGLVRGGEYGVPQFNAALQINCPELYDVEVPELAPFADIVVVYVTLADTWARSWDGGGTWLRPTDPEFKDRVLADYASFTEQQFAAGVDKVVWLRPPATSRLDASGAWTTESSFLDGGQDVIEDAIHELKRRWPDRVIVADMRSWFEFAGHADDEQMRPDGTHLSPTAAYEVASEWLGPLLIQLGVD